MAELAAVTDTHPLVFHAQGGKKLGRMAAKYFAAVERQEGLVYVPSAVLWQIGLLVRARRIRLGRSLRSFASDLFSNPAYQPLDCGPEQVFLADEARPNEDPFDALICAAARGLDLPLLSRDTDIHDFAEVTAIW